MSAHCRCFFSFAADGSRNLLTGQSIAVAGHKHESYVSTEKQGSSRYRIRHTRTLQGFVALKDVCGKEKEDSMRSFLFAEIFKRYYLLFAPDKALDFDA